MSESTRTSFAAGAVEAIQRDGTLTRDLMIAEWMQRSRPHGEYRGSPGDFSIVASSGQTTPAGPSDWVVRIGGQFHACPPRLFEALINLDPPTTLCAECHDPSRPSDLRPGPDGLDLCADCILELELSRQDPDTGLDRTEVVSTRPIDEPERDA